MTGQVRGRVTQGLIAAGVALLSIAALTYATDQRSARAAGATLSFTPASQTVSENASSINVDVTVAGASGLAAWEFRLNYNPAVLDYVSATPDPSLLQGSGKAVTCPGVIADETAGTVLLGCLIIDAGASASGSGKLATINFAAKDPGKSPLVFSKLELSGVETETGIPNLPVNGGTGMIKVSGGTESNSVEPTPTVNPALLTPTAPGGEVPTPIDPNDPNLGPQTPRAATATPRSGTTGSGSSSSGSGGSSSGGTTSGSTASSGAGNVQGASTGANTTTGPDGAPVAGYGSLEEGQAVWPRYAYAAMALLGITSIAAGYALSRRQRPLEQ